MDFLTNDAGDVYARRDGGRETTVDPDRWGWLSRANAAPPDARRSLDQLRGLPGFEVAVLDGPRFVPGPKRRGLVWMAWPDGAAPPSAIESKGGVEGTLAYFDRLSDAIGRVAVRLPVRPERAPFVVHDLVSGRRIEVTYRPPPLGPGGEGIVYVLDDGDAFKIGHTTGPPALRVAGLQTGNPRVIRAVATIAGASPEVEAHLHRELAEWIRRGEWFEREPIENKVERAGGWAAFLRQHLPAAEWQIEVYV